MDLKELERALLDLVAQDGYRPSKPRVLAKLLALKEDDQAALKRVVKRLVKQGKLVYGANHLIGPAEPGTPGYRVTGVFRRAGAGFGFVRPAGSAPGADRKLDIYIPQRDAADAATGDTVLVRLKKRPTTNRPNPEGEIVEIIERETHRFVGTYFEAGGSAYARIDGGAFSQPIFVGDPGAKSAQHDDKVVVEMVRFPSQVHDGEGVIVEVLGPRGRPGVDTLSIIREFDLPDEFPADVLDNARAEAAAFDESIPPERRDLTGLTVITIDPIDARDFDDAISLERNEAGHWVLGVHIADVSHFVKPRTPLDREALHRATSVYLPDRVLPMLPELISNGLASLQPDRVRYTKSVLIEMTGEGVVVHVEPLVAAIRSRRRFTYEEVDQFLADRAAWRDKLSPEVFGLLARMHELAMLLRERRFRRGALELSMNEVKVDLDRHGQVVGAHLVENTESHQIIEEFMLQANEAVAEFLHRHHLAFLRRVHQAPDPYKLKLLTEFVNGLGIACDSLESRFELQKLLKAVVGQPHEHAVNYATLRSLARAIYSPEEEGHYALASDCYAHFTSPIRRYPDLTVHRLLEAVLLGKKPRPDFGELAVLGEHCSDRERRAESAERELVKVKLLNYLASRIGQRMRAVVTGVEEFGLFAQGVDIPAEGLIHVTSLQDDYYRYDRSAHTLAGFRSGNSFRLGDVLDVAVARIDVDRRELDFRLVGRGERAEPRGGRGTGRTERGKPRKALKTEKKRQRRDKAKKRKRR